MNADVSDYYPNSETLTHGFGGKWSRAFFYFYSWTPDDVQRRKCTCLHSCWRPCETMHGQQKIRFILPSTSCFFFVFFTGETAKGQTVQSTVWFSVLLAGTYRAEPVEWASVNQWVGCGLPGLWNKAETKDRFYVWYHGFVTKYLDDHLTMWLLLQPTVRLLTNQEECSMKWHTDQHDTGAKPHSCLASMFTTIASQSHAADDLFLNIDLCWACDPVGVIIVQSTYIKVYSMHVVRCKSWTFKGFSVCSIFRHPQRFHLKRYYYVFLCQKGLEVEPFSQTNLLLVNKSEWVQKKKKDGWFTSKNENTQRALVQS